MSQRTSELVAAAVSRSEIRLLVLPDTAEVRIGCGRRGDCVFEDLEHTSQAILERYWTMAHNSRPMISPLPPPGLSTGGRRLLRPEC
jgi:hypothetical protein